MENNELISNGRFTDKGYASYCLKELNKIGYIDIRLTKCGHGFEFSHNEHNIIFWLNKRWFSSKTVAVGQGYGINNLVKKLQDLQLFSARLSEYKKTNAG